MNQGRVRIIAGEWRGRLLKVPDVPGLRPTPNRVRETVFNWLAQQVPGARCLDLFAGSGAFGFECLSRGASYVEMVDQSPIVVALLKNEADFFKAKHVKVYQAVVPKGLLAVNQPFDIVFLDPPYQAGLLLPTCHYLEAQGYLASSAWIYLEANVAIKENDLPANWRVIKSLKAGQVFYHLARRAS